ncbi:hypothetical protein [Mucilaginibacter sp. CSA2-8R]|uniref:hypothetical protein n=1 Tax=Mucilaginibacter sp. CSA2-8R TaxID=3141542 RepID=UPI00315CE0D1
MSYYRPIEALLTNEIILKREGFWRPVYQFTDGQYSYGLLRHEGFWRTKVIMETANQNWITDGNKWKKRAVKNEKGEELATLSHNFWGTKITFTANDGFTATFEKPSVWRGLTVWKAAAGITLLSIEPRLFKTPSIKVNPEAKSNKWILMLAFLALELSLEAQKRAAAAST